MAEEGGNFGLLARIEAHAFGEPGKRTFRLWAGVAGRSASLWLEKEQLVALAAAIDDLFTAIGDEAGARASTDDETPSPDEEVTLDLHIGSLALGYDQQAGLLRIYAGPVGGFQSDPPAFSCMVTRDQMQALRSGIEGIVRAGRPMCQLCHEPMDPEGHACPKQNGHSKQGIPPLPE